MQDAVECAAMIAPRYDVRCPAPPGWPRAHQAHASAARLVLAIGALLGGAAPSRAWAQQQPSPGQGTAAQARALFERGVAALDDGRPRDAIEPLEQSRALRALPVVDYNLGLAYRGAGRYLDAIRAFERYLASPPPQASPADLAAVQRALGELRSGVATLVVNVTPAAAAVLLDGRTVQWAGNTAQVDPGDHVLEAQADGYALERRAVSLPRGARAVVALVLAPASGLAHLVVVPSVPDAMTSVDGRQQATSAVDLALPSGEHTVFVRAPGYAPFERRVTLGATGVVRVDAHLARAGGGGSSWLAPAAIAVGVVVVGAIVTGVVLALQPRQGNLDLLPPAGLGTAYEPR
jgi:hypothetical protein